MSLKSIEIRFAEKQDMKFVLELIKELAAYEKALHEVSNSEEQLINDCFGSNPAFECLVALSENKVIGFALFFPVYSTWKGRCLYLEDICVKGSERRHGIGKMLFDAVKQIAENRGMKRLSWQVLDWNESAISFYKKYQTEFDETWINCKIRFV